VLKAVEQFFSYGRLAVTGFLSMLPVDQGIEHSAGASFAPNPAYFDPENIFGRLKAGFLGNSQGSACFVRGMLYKGGFSLSQ